MNIVVEQIDDNINCTFVDYDEGKRMWIRDDSLWFPTVGWCPHLNIGGGECNDCSLVLESE